MTLLLSLLVTLGDPGPLASSNPAVPAPSSQSASAPSTSADAQGETLADAVSNKYPPVAPEDRDRLLVEIDDAAQHFEAVAASFAEDVARSAAHKYAQRKASIRGAYEDRIVAIEVEERSRRASAIALFEAFLRKHPTDPAYTPDAMFRLAELYFERANDEYFVAMRAFEERLAKDPDSTEAAPKQRYDATIALYRDLIARFFDYKLLDAAHYLLGYCLGEQGDEEQAVLAYQQLVDKFPRSKFVTEAWTRIGEYYFDANQLARAADAYLHVLESKTSSYYDKALYKLGWTYFRLDRYDDAVARFAELVDFADAKSKDAATSGAATAGSELRKEAILYLGLSFADEVWGGLEKARRYFSEHPHDWAHEALAMLADISFDQSKFPEAVAAYEASLAAKPLDRNAPKRQDKIVQAHERVRDFEAAARARETLVTAYAEGSPWYEANASDSDAVVVARELSERSLLSAALFFHKQAQAFKEAKKLQEAQASYKRAADGYAAYLRRFAFAKNRYELTYYLADAQYYALSFGAAAKTFGVVRDDDSDSQYRELAAFSAVLAAEREIAQQESGGALAKRPVMKSSERAAQGAPSPLPIAAPRLALIEASDRFITRTEVSEKTPSVLYKAGEVLYAHDHFPQARQRFERIIREFPTSEVARFALNLTVESFITEQNWDAVETFATDAMNGLRGGKADEPFRAELMKFKLGAMFKKAEALEAGGQFEAAAAEYIRIVDTSPQSEFADKALNNAAVDYEKARRFESAMKLYERIPRDYPKSSLADAALFRVGVNSERFYDFEKAIRSYEKLVTDYPQSPRRPDALYNAALSLENTQQYGRAVDAYKRYAAMFADRPDSADVYFKAARAAESGGDRKAAVATYEAFIARYGKTKASDERVVEALLRVGELHVVGREERAAKAAFAGAVKESNKRKAGARFAAQAQFQLAELAFADYDAVAPSGSSKQQKAAIVKRAGLLTKVRDAFQLVFAFRQVEWTLAALYRIGNLYETFSDRLFTAPPPPEVAKLGPEYVEEYRVLIEEQAVPLEDKAVDAYKRTIAEAKKAGVANEWTKRTLKSLNKLRKKEFPLQKDAKFALERDAFALPPLVGAELVRAASSQPEPGAVPAESEAGGAASDEVSGAGAAAAEVAP